ncbi:MAG: hypothetical protein M1541_04550 [Acidobacteria bacterium]|nr:hypothetical protein [Acidobacteriota bacterium]
MKRLLQLGFLFALLLVPRSGMAQDVRCTPARGGAGCGFAERVVQALEGLELACSAWSISILEDSEWSAMLAALRDSGHISHTDRAFTLIASGRTYLRRSAFLGSSEARLPEVLLHEFAHLRFCGADEPCARAVAARSGEFPILDALEQARRGLLPVLQDLRCGTLDADRLHRAETLLAALRLALKNEGAQIKKLDAAVKEKP